MTKDRAHAISDLCQAIGARSLECKGYSGEAIQNVALQDVKHLSEILLEEVSKELGARPLIKPL